MNIHAQVVINEISYNPPESGNDSLEYIELYNAGGSEVNLQGWHFTAGVEDTFPDVTIAPGEYFVTAISAQAMQNVFHISVHEWSAGALNNTGESIILFDASNNYVDSVRYADSNPWPTEADGSGPSLELISPELDNNDGTNWQISGNGTGVIINGNEVFGTPGAENSGGGTGGPDLTIEVAHLEFTPKNAVVALGEVVRWSNQEDIPHNVNGTQDAYPNNPADIYSGAPAPGPWEFDYTTTTPGYYQYHCDVHVLSGMVGTLGVYDPLDYTDFPLRVLRLTDDNGSHIYDGVPTRVTGVVHGINFLPTGYSFYVINDENVGINVFSLNPGTYNVQEGDLVTVSGVIDQFNGLLEIVPDDIEVISTNQSLNTPIELGVPDETTEGSYVVIAPFCVDSVVETGASGWNVFGKNGTGENVLVRLDVDAGFSPPSAGECLGVYGVGTQFDSSFPFTSGYQVLAIQLFPLPGFPVLPANAISMDPNPSSSFVQLSSDLVIDRIDLLMLDGKMIRSQVVNAKAINLKVDDLMEGMYIVRAMTKDGIWTSKLVKE